MNYSNEQGLLQDLKEKKEYPVYLLFGTEDYLKKVYTDRLLKAFGMDTFQEMNLHVLDGEGLDIDKLADSVEALPFFADKRCVVVQDFDYEGLDTPSRKKCLELLENPPQTTRLLLVVKKQDFLPNKSAKAKELVKAVDKVGAVLPLQKRDKAQLYAFIKSRLKIWGCTISNDLCRTLIQRCSDDMLTLKNEADKLGASCPGQEITKEQIERITVAAVDASIYDLSKAVLRGDYPKAMGILEDLFYLRQPATLILSSLTSSFVDLYRGKVADRCGKSAKEVANDFDYKRKEFRIQNAMRDCKGYPLEFLREVLRLLVQADGRLKSTRCDENIVLEQLITEMFHKRQELYHER